MIGRREIIACLCGVALALCRGQTPVALYAENALTPERRQELARTLPAALSSACGRIAARRAEHARVFAGAPGSVQAVRSGKRLEMAERLCGVARKTLAGGGTDGLCRAEVMVAELEAFDRCFADEYAAWKTCPLAPGVSATRLSARDFGAKGDGVADDAPALEAVFARVRALGGAPSIVELPEGTYRLVGRGGDFLPHLIAHHLTNCVVRGVSPERTKIVYGRYDGDGIDFRFTSNVTLANVEVRWEETPFVQGIVESVDVATGSLVLRHQAGTLRPDDPRFRRAGHPNSCVQFNAERRPIRTPVLWYGYRCDNLGNGRYRMYFAPEYGSTKTMPAQVGATFVFPDRSNRLQALRASSSMFCTFENVWIRNSRGGSISPGVAVHPTVYRCRIFPLSPALALSTNADGFYCPNGSAIIDCDFTNMNDDGCNSHGNGKLLLRETEKGDGYVHAPFWQEASPGELLQIIRSMDGRYLANVRCGTKRLDRSEGRPLEQTTLLGPLPQGIRTYASLGIPEYTPLEWRAIALGTRKAEKYPDQIHAPLLFGTGFVCSGNRFANLRGVAIQVQCPSSLIESNVVDTVYRGIELSGLLHYQEGPPPYNVVIRGNAIRHVDVGIKSAFMTANHPPAVTAPISDILIERNHLADIARQAFPLANMSDSLLTGNTLDGRAATRDDLSLTTCAGIVCVQ